MVLVSESLNFFNHVNPYQQKSVTVVQILIVYKLYIHIYYCTNLHVHYKTCTEKTEILKELRF